MENEIKEAGIKLASELLQKDELPSLPMVFEAGALSEAAKQYWFNQFQQEYYL